MVQDPTKFDVLVMPNLYGDILRYLLNYHFFWCYKSVHTSVCLSVFLSVYSKVTSSGVRIRFSCLSVCQQLPQIKQAHTLFLCDF